MATNLDIDPAILEEAVDVGEHRTKKAAVTQALREYIERHRQKEILEFFGTIDYDESYDYKEQRKQP